MNVLTVTSFYALLKCLCCCWALSYFLTSPHLLIDKFWLFQGTFTAILYFIFIAFSSRICWLGFASVDAVFLSNDIRANWFNREMIRHTILFKKSVSQYLTQRKESSWTVLQTQFYSLSFDIPRTSTHRYRDIDSERFIVAFFYSFVSYFRNNKYSDKAIVWVNNFKIVCRMI